MNFEYGQEDERLVRTIFRNLIHRYRIFGIDEEDLVQEGSLAFLKAKVTYQVRGKAKFETYAYVVIRNHVFDYIRKEKKLPLVEPGSDDPMFPGVQPKDTALWEILREVLKNHCNDLERSIFNAYYKGYSYHEICEIFEISKKKVDNTIQKIYRAARSIYAD